ncbi:PRC-barrel domain-containing protein [Corynebacterium cystitidis]|uniref:PRC-barrel domain-containing protein n=1 Tax=Corynebacterium cystitidis TaxID=35757 RepID=UPI00211E858C|nr:PRC-barrel domain-containing protein [Corynebacterium cystitidis]
MNNTHEIDVLLDATAFDANGDKLGAVNDVFLNDRDGQPDFVDVSHGLFGRNNSIVPLRGHTIRDGELHLAFEKDRIKDAPELGEDGHLSATDRDSFYRHYQVNTLEDVTRYKDARPAQSRTGEKRGVGGTILDDSHADADRERVEAGAAEDHEQDSDHVYPTERLP